MDGKVENHEGKTEEEHAAHTHDEEDKKLCQPWVDANTNIQILTNVISIILLLINVMIELSMYILRGWRKPIDDNKLQVNAMSVIACF